MGSEKSPVKAHLLGTFNELMKTYGHRNKGNAACASRSRRLLRNHLGIRAGGACMPMVDEYAIACGVRQGDLSLFLPDETFHDVIKVASRQGKGGQSKVGLPPLPKKRHRPARALLCSDDVMPTSWLSATCGGQPIPAGPECLADPRDLAEWGPGDVLIPRKGRVNGA